MLLQSAEQISAAIAEADCGPLALSLPVVDVPEIDISPFLHPHDGSDDQREAVVSQCLAAATTVGFLNIVGHGVDQSQIDGMLLALTRFFQSPIQEKETCVAFANGTQRGYVSFGSENGGSVLGRETSADPRECYVIGPPEHMGGAAYGANAYPDFITGFREQVDDYYAEMERLEKLLLEIFSRALAKATGVALSPKHLEEQIAPNRGMLKGAWYPPRPALADGPRCEGHTDWGPLTILLASSPGLEICLKSQDDGKYQWRMVPVVPGAFTVNVADQLARWSNDRFISCIHRVNGNFNSHLPRISIPYFSTQILPRSQLCEPMIACICSDGEEAKYEPLSIREYIQQKFSKFQANAHNGGA